MGGLGLSLNSQMQGDTCSYVLLHRLLLQILGPLHPQSFQAPKAEHYRKLRLLNRAGKAPTVRRKYNLIAETIMDICARRNQPNNFF